MTEKQYTVYAIVDSDTNVIIYYGQTYNIKQRMDSHKSCIKLKSSVLGTYIAENKIKWHYKIVKHNLSESESKSLEKELIIEHQTIANIIHRQIGVSNMLDNDMQYGTDVHTSKLTEDDVRAIRKDTRSNVELATQYIVDSSNISNIRLRKTWKHIPAHPNDTPIDSLGDAMMPKGEDHCRAKLTDDDIRAIRKDTRKLQDIADQYYTYTGNIHAIKTYKSWKHIPPHPDDIQTDDGRHYVRGANMPGAKLTEDKVRAIRKDTRYHRIIAEQYGIAASYVSKIKLRTRWGWIDD